MVTQLKQPSYPLCSSIQSQVNCLTTWLTLCWFGGTSSSIRPTWPFSTCQADNSSSTKPLHIEVLLEVKPQPIPITVVITVAGHHAVLYVACTASALHELSSLQNCGPASKQDVRVSFDGKQSSCCLQQLGAGTSSRASLVQTSLTPIGEHRDSLELTWSF